MDNIVIFLLRLINMLHYINNLDNGEQSFYLE